MRAAAAMGWHPQQFWKATPREMRVAFEGFARGRGLKITTFADRVSSPSRLARLKQLNDNPEKERKPGQ